MYVARFTKDPQDDIERGWSGYMMDSFATVNEAVEWHVDYGGVELEDWQDKSDDELIDLLSDANIDLRFDKHLSAWRVVDHDGLSCFPLEATTAEAATAEARNAGLKWEGNGSKTLGAVKLIAKVEGVDDLFVFECDDAVREN